MDRIAYVREVRAGADPANDEPKSRDHIAEIDLLLLILNAELGQVAVYELLGRGGVLYGYEVVIVKIAPAEEILGRQYPEREVYPSSRKDSDDWGRISWSYGRDYFQDALARYAGLVTEQEKYGFSASGAVLGQPQEEAA